MKQYLIISSAITEIDRGLKIKLIPWEAKALVNLNLLDYDGIILDATSMPYFAHGDSPFGDFEQNILTPLTISRTLFSKNTPVILLGNPDKVICDASFSNSLGLDMSCDGKPGHNLEVRCKNDHIFYHYVRQLHSYSYSFNEFIRLINEVVGASDDFSHCLYNMCFTEVLLATRVGDPIAVQLGARSPDGSSFNSLYLLPELPSGAKDSIEQIVDIVFTENNSDDTTEPDWAKQIKVDGQESIDLKIDKNQNKINELNKEIQKLYKEKQKLRQPIEVLYKTGKTLEQSVGTALFNTGFEILKPMAGCDCDLLFALGENKFVAEVKSTKKDVIGKLGLRQVVDWQDIILSQTDEDYKPIVIVSNNVNNPIDKRQSNFITPDSETYIKKHKIALISVCTLFQAMQSIADGKLRIDDFSMLLVRTVGIVTL